MPPKKKTPKLACRNSESDDENLENETNSSDSDTQAEFDTVFRSKRLQQVAAKKTHEADAGNAFQKDVTATQTGPITRPRGSTDSPHKSTSATSKEPPPPKYTKNHTAACIGEMVLPSGKQAVKFEVKMNPTAMCPDRSNTTYIGYVTTREWQDGRSALIALGQSLKPFPKVLKCDEFENYSDYLQELHEIWEMGMTEDRNKECLNLDEPSFHMENKRLFFISGNRQIWDMDEKPCGKKLSEEEINSLSFCIMYSGKEIAFTDDPKKMLELLSLAWDLFNQGQLYNGPEEEDGSMFLGLGPSMMSSVLKGYLYTPAHLRGLMPHVTAYLSGKAYGTGKSWSALIAAHAALGGKVSDVMLNAKSSVPGLWKHLDRQKITIIDELSPDPVFLTTVSDIVDNKFNNCKKQVNEKAYFPTAGVVLCGNYMKRDLVSVTKGRAKEIVLQEKTLSKMEFCFAGRKEICHPDTKQIRDESLEAAAEIYKYFPNLLAMKWHSLFEANNLDGETKEKIASFTSSNRSGTFLAEFITFCTSVKDQMMQNDVRLPPCLQSEEVDLNVHTYFLVNKDQDVEGFLTYVLETENHNLIEFCQHGKVPGVKLRPADFADAPEWNDFLNDSRKSFCTTFRGNQKERVTFLPTNSVHSSVIENLKKKRFSVENAIQEEVLLVERELNKTVKKLMTEVKKAVVVFEATLQNLETDEEDENMEGVPGPSRKNKKNVPKKTENFFCDLPNCRKNGFPYKTKASFESHKKSGVHQLAIQQNVEANAAK